MGIHILAGRLVGKKLGISWHLVGQSEEVGINQKKSGLIGKKSGLIKKVGIDWKKSGKFRVNT